MKTLTMSQSFQGTTIASIAQPSNLPGIFFMTLTTNIEICCKKVVMEEQRNWSRNSSTSEVEIQWNQSA